MSAEGLAVGADASGVPAAEDQRLSWSRRLAPVVALLFLAPWTAECSWGGFAAGDFLIVVVVLGPMYGGAAILIREAARRTGAGWPAIVLLAAAFGIVQAGLVDQSLFNPDFLSDTEFAEWSEQSRATYVPALGFSAADLLSYVGNHIALSICAPIALVESYLGPRRRHAAWLGRPGLVVVGIIYLLGSLLIFSDVEHVVTPVQFALAAALIGALVGAAALPRWRHVPPRSAARAPRVLWAGLVVLAGQASADLVPGWAGVAIHTAVAVAVATVVVRWARRTGWGQRHVLAAWSAGLISAAGFAYLVPNYAPASPTEALVGDVMISVVTALLVGGAFWRLRRTAGDIPGVGG